LEESLFEIHRAKTHREIFFFWDLNEENISMSLGPVYFKKRFFQHFPSMNSLGTFAKITGEAPKNILLYWVQY